MSALVGLFTAAPAFAHHGKDFLLTSTDDMPQPGHIYSLLSSDNSFERGGTRRSIEYTPGVLFALGSRFSLEPHGHIARSEEGNDFQYGATAIEARYRIGFLGRSEWRWGASLEFEHPRGEEHDNLEGRLLFVRNFPSYMVALNLVANQDVVDMRRTPLSVIGGILRPFGPTDNLGLEFRMPFPLADGVEILPGIYHTFGGPNGTTSLKLGIGLLTSRETTSGTIHTAFVQRF
jgi:hypothetical protein